MNIEKRITKNKLTSENEYRKTNKEKQTNFSLLYLAWISVILSTLS